MNKKLILFLGMWLAGFSAIAQQPAKKPLRVVDSLPVKEAADQYRILFRSELDSLINLYAPVQTPVKLQPGQKTEKDNSSIFIYAALGLVILIMGGVLFLLQRQRKDLLELPGRLKAQQLPQNGKLRNGKKVTGQSLEERIGELDAELLKLTKENEGLNRVISTYNGIQHEYESLKHGMQKAYKIRNYPGYDKAKNDTGAMQTVLETENALAGYAYEKFLKPVLAITDAHKNSPSKISAPEREKLLDLLLSLSFLYIEYLYLRVNELSVGGNMVQRISAFTRGDQPDPQLLKKLNTESGSRALVMRLTLNKASVCDLSYPVFDETNLNSH